MEQQFSIVINQFINVVLFLLYQMEYQDLIGNMALLLRLRPLQYHPLPLLPQADPYNQV